MPSCFQWRANVKSDTLPIGNAADYYFQLSKRHSEYEHIFICFELIICIILFADVELRVQITLAFMYAKVYNEKSKRRFGE